MATPPKENVRVARLDTLGNVSRELGRLYRAARRGDTSTQDAARLATILTALRQCLEQSEIEHRIAEMEEKLGSDNVVPFRRQA